MSIHQKSMKDEMRSTITRRNGLGNKSRALILLDISSPEVRDFLQSAGKALDIGMMLPHENVGAEYGGYDAFITDTISESVDVIALVKLGVVPIMPVENTFAKNLQEFDPMKFTGNAFLFAQTDIYHIFEKLIRYLENVRYAGDRRILIENVRKTF